MTNGEGTGGWLSHHKGVLGITLIGLVLIGLTWLAVQEPSASTATTTGSESATSIKSGGDVDATGGTDGINDDGTTDSSGASASNSSGGTTGSSSDGTGSTGASSPPVATQPTLSTVTNSKSFAAVAYDSVSVACPAGTVAVGGGFRGPETTKFFASYLTNNGWYVRAVNGTLGASTIHVYAQCVANIPGSVSVSTATTSIGGLSNGTTSKNCPSGSTVVSGGYDNTENGLIMTFSNKVDNGWRVNATSDAIAAQTLKVLSNCYSGSVSLAQILATDSVPAGWTWTKTNTCDNGLSISAGFASRAELLITYFNTNNSKWTTGVYNRTDESVNFKAYFYCATFST